MSFQLNRQSQHSRFVQLDPTEPRAEKNAREDRGRARAETYADRNLTLDLHRDAALLDARPGGELANPLHHEVGFILGNALGTRPAINDTESGAFASRGTRRQIAVQRQRCAVERTTQVGRGGWHSDWPHGIQVAACNRRHEHNLVAILEAIIVSTEETDILFIDVNVDEGSQAPRVVP